MTQRLEFIDIAKGLGIILVILSHSVCPDLMFYTSACFVPIFFFCSGFTSTHKNITLKENFVSHTIKLLKPYLLFSIILLLYFQDFSLRAVIGIFYSRYCLYPFGTVPNIEHLMTIGNYPMWFLTCMVATYFFYDVIIYFPKLQYYIIILYLLITIITTHLPILLPWSLDTAPFMAIIMYCGTLLKVKYPNIFSLKKPHPIIILSIAAYFLLLPLCYNINISVRMYGPSVVVYLLAALTGSIMLIYFSRLLQGTIMSKGFMLVGIHSLTIFSIEIPFVLIGKKVAFHIQELYPQFQKPEITAIIQLIMALIGGYIISIIIQSNQYTKKLFF